MAEKKSSSRSTGSAKSSENSSSNSSSFRLYRSETNRVLGGVAGGLGEAFDIDSTLIRLIFILLFIFGGSGILIYLLLWLVIPSESMGSTTRDTIHNTVDEMRGRAHEFSQRFRDESRKQGSKSFLGIIIILFGLAFLLGNFGFATSFDRWWPIILVILGFFMITKVK